MQVNFYWINFCFCFILTWVKVELKTLSEQELKEMKQELDDCCKTNVCIQNSCYTVEWRASSWAAMRQRCQGRYPDWPHTVDIFHIHHERDIETLSKMLQETPKHIGGNSPPPNSVWTSGTRCPKTSKVGPVLVTRWTSTNKGFPHWLEHKTTTGTGKLDKNEGCKFLVVYPATNESDVRYDFQDQSARHAAICEFLFPGDLGNTTDEEDDSDYSLEETDYSSTIITETTVSSTHTTAMAIKSKTLGPADQSKESTKSDSTTPKIISVTPTTSTTHLITTTKKYSTYKSTELIQLSSSTPKPKKFCKGKFVAGINWPDADPGVTVNMSCPEGMTGYAQWKCSESTLEYIPTKPHIQDCRHVWIKDLEKEVDSGKVDAVDISHKLANETERKDLSHGDITALVDLSSKLLRLYVQQNGEEKIDLAGKPETHVSYNFTGSMVTSMSNILRADIKTAWEVLPEIHQTRAASKILELVTTMGSRLSCIKKSEEKLQFTVQSENIGMQTFILNNTTPLEEDLITFPQEVPGVEADNLLLLPSEFELKKWYSPCRNYKTAVGVLYNNVGDFLKDENLPGSTTHIVTKVISFSLSNSSESISLPSGKEVTVVLKHILTKDIRRGYLKNPQCMFWNFSKQTYGQWDSSGCDLIDYNQTHTICRCDHLTNFAVLMDINNNIQEDEIQSFMTYVCCGVSSLALIATLICFIAIRSMHGKRSIITGNLCFCLLITNLLIIFGLDKTENKIICATIAGLLHFWILSAFFWMLVEGYHLYKMVILVFQRGRNLSVKIYYIFAYGCPLIIVGISAGIKTDGYGSKDYCWLSHENGLMWSFVGPACVVILINIVVFILTLRSASSVRIKREQTTLKKIKSWTRGSFSVMCLLGLTWCLGLFYIDEKMHVVSYIFTLLNGLQGVFIFFFHILLNDKVKTTCFMKCKGKKKEDWEKFPPQTSSNRLYSKTSTRTSINSNGCASRNISVINSRGISTEITSVRSTHLLKDTRGSYTNGNAEHPSSSNCDISYRRNKATHTMSSNGLQQLPVSEPSRVRSLSFPKEIENVSQRNTSEEKKMNNSTRFNKRNSKNMFESSNPL